MTTSDEVVRQRAEVAQEALAAAAQRVPQPTSWGLLETGDAPPAIGGGVGGFLWFESRAAMAEYVRRDLAFSCQVPVGADPLAVADRVSALLAAREADETPEALREMLNVVLRRLVQIEWWGTLSELMTGSQPRAARVRAWFREQNGGSGSDAPIAMAEQAAFVAVLSEYGL